MFAPSEKKPKKSAKKSGVWCLSLDDGGGKHFVNLIFGAVMSLLPQSTTTKGRA
jgi:hypothetical protein